jgi:hypothetical protein
VKSLAEEEAASSSPSFIRPSFTAKKIGQTVVFMVNKGDVGNLGFRDDPYKSPIRKQILIEALRRAVTEAHLGEPFGAAKPADSRAISDESTKWQCYLDQAEQVVKQMVVAIETVTDRSQLERLLGSGEDQIDDLIYNKFFDSFEEYAEENKYAVIYDRGQVKRFSVTISSEPAGAKVWRMTHVVYRKQLKFNVDPSQWPWEEVVQNPVDMLGKYRYMARWQDGRQAEGTINVENAGPITFRPQ